MPGGPAVAPLLLLLLALALPSPGPAGENTELPPFSRAGRHYSILEDMGPPALSATVIIIVIIIISVSAYLCFLKYICSGCCKATQVEPDRRLDPSRFEEQVESHLIR